MFMYKKGYKFTEEHKKHLRESHKGFKHTKETLEKIAKANTTHGENPKNSSEYSSWAAMKTRCYNLKQIGYRLWGGRGITVCSEWLNSYEQFLKDMGRKPNKSYSLDRIDNDKGYSKDNCRWSTRHEQNLNRRNSYIYQGKCASDWAREMGFSRQVLLYRLKTGWPYDLAISTPKLITCGRRYIVRLAE